MEESSCTGTQPQVQVTVGNTWLKKEINKQTFLSNSARVISCFANCPKAHEGVGCQQPQVCPETLPQKPRHSHKMGYSDTSSWKRC